MLILGLVGGIASGKSLVAGQLRALGAAVLDADRAGHEVLREAEVIKTLVERWGPGILDAAGQISRSAVAKIVFAAGADGEKRFLESLTHPRIQMRLQQEIAAIQSRPAAPRAAVLDAALLFEAGWEQVCDFVIFVEAPDHARQARAATRGWSAEQLAAREAAQLALGEKQARSDFVVDNGGTAEATAVQVRELWNRLFPAA
ncbi:MAG: dephospho-CoA kinase [Pirellulaceae bacterium]|nr:dephospho-CoA kinase [Pirellulaceae bacterium]